MTPTSLTRAKTRSSISWAVSCSCRLWRTRCGSLLPLMQMLQRRLQARVASK
ncbi:MAG: hypothetical protein M5U12_00260 [Verrucomicrobia bacterium]|nr:hypothetical protein [Verrucomicrobiota bacterium]